MATSFVPAIPDLTVPAGAQGIDALAKAIARLRANSSGQISAQPLRGRNIGILCDDTQRDDAIVLQRAASELGARVALVQASFDVATARPQLEHAARVLGRLYDAVICIDLSGAVVQLLRETAGIPVLSDVIERWAALQAAPQGAGTEARHLLQALLCV